MFENDRNFWRDRKVLLTGHTGFKGGWLSIWLNRLGAKVFGLSLSPDERNNFYKKGCIQNLLYQSCYIDIRDSKAVNLFVKNINPEVVFHLAAQALVKRSYSDPLESFGTNVMGTANILDSIKAIDSVKVAVMVTTDKVYATRERGYKYKENDTLGGWDPYSASKAASELVIESYKNSYLNEHGVAMASVRAGNVIGGGDWSENRLIPDAVKAWKEGNSLNVRMPEAIRPWQHVLDPLYGYLVLAQKLWNDPSLSGAYNFGPESSEAISVKDLIMCASKFWPDAKVHFGKNSDINYKESHSLELDVTKTQRIIGVHNCWDTNKAIEKTINWYKKENKGENILKLCELDVQDYEAGHAI